MQDLRNHEELQALPIQRFHRGDDRRREAGGGTRKTVEYTSPSFSTLPPKCTTAGRLGVSEFESLDGVKRSGRDS